MSADLVAWLCAQLDEDEQAIRRACAYSIEAFVHAGPVGAYLERFDPARELREVEAKRRIVDHEIAQLRTSWLRRAEEHRQTFEMWLADVRPSITLCLLALPNADQPGYREEWRP